MKLRSGGRSASAALSAPLGIRRHGVTIGLDLGATGVRAAVVAPASDRAVAAGAASMVVQRLGSEPLPPGAAPRAPVLAAVQAVQKAGLSVQRVDLSSFGMLRAIGSAGHTVEALVDIGSELTTIVIHRHGVPHVVRVVAFGGRQLTDRLADSMGIGPVDAEAAKCTVGAVGDSAPALQMRDELRRLLTEVRASLRFFVTTVGSAVERVLLTGGTSTLPGLADLLCQELDIPVRVITPLRHLGGYVGGHLDGLDAAPSGRLHAAVGPPAAATAVSVGLALGVAA